MKRFQNHQRVRIVKPDHYRQCIEGWTGTVVNLRMDDDAAWVQMDRDLPSNLASFPSDDPRARHIMLWPDECKALPASA
jgi:hypothetical protein